MLIGGKEFKFGDHIRIVKAYSDAYYKNRQHSNNIHVEKDVDENRTGLTGVIVFKDNNRRITPYRVLVRIDDADVRKQKYYHGETYVYPEDEVELITE